MEQNIQKMNAEQSHADDELISRALGEPERTPPDGEWDAGDMGCGELLFQLVFLGLEEQGHPGLQQLDGRLYATPTGTRRRSRNFGRRR